MGTRKVTTLLGCGAKVTVISPELTETLLHLSETKAIKWISRAYDASDLKDAFLVIAATSDHHFNHQIYLDAQKLKKLCNIVDQPQACDFILPSVINRGDLILTVSTSGKSPAYAKKIKQQLESFFGREHAVFLRMMGAIRKRLLAENSDTESHKILFERLIDANIVELIKNHRISQINEKLTKILGKGYDVETLINVEDDLKTDH